MPRSPEMGFNPQESNEKPKDTKSERKVIVIKKGSEQKAEKLDITLDNFTEVPNQETRNRHGEVIPQDDRDWKNDLKAIVKLKQESALDAKSKAKRDFDDLFKK
jgi:hypothetical protein